MNIDWYHLVVLVHDYPDRVQFRVCGKDFQIPSSSPYFKIAKTLKVGTHISYEAEGNEVTRLSLVRD